MRRTIGTAGNTSPSGTVYVTDEATHQLGFISNTTPIEGGPIEGARKVRPGTRLRLEVEDRGDVMVVLRAAVAEG